MPDGTRILPDGTRIEVDRGSPLSDDGDGADFAAREGSGRSQAELDAETAEAARLA